MRKDSDFSLALSYEKQHRTCADVGMLMDGSIIAIVCVCERTFGAYEYKPKSVTILKINHRQSSHGYRISRANAH